MKPEQLEHLKMRLLKGEISTSEYLEIRKILSEDTPTEPQKVTPQSRESLGGKLISFEGFDVFERGFSYKGKIHSLESVISARSGGSFSSMNFIPTEKFSSFGMVFSDGDEIRFFEEKILFRGERHKQISDVGRIVKKITFQHRLAHLVAEIKSGTPIQLGKSFSNIYGEVFLNQYGDITCAGTTINIKTARESGVLALGTEWNSLSGRRQKSNPSEIVVAAERAFFKDHIPKNSIVFIATGADTDVLMSLLEWWSAIGNQI